MIWELSLVVASNSGSRRAPGMIARVFRSWTATEELTRRNAHQGSRVQPFRVPRGRSPGIVRRRLYFRNLLIVPQVVQRDVQQQLIRVDRAKERIRRRVRLQRRF